MITISLFLLIALPILFAVFILFFGRRMTRPVLWKIVEKKYKPLTQELFKYESGHGRDGVMMAAAVDRTWHIHGVYTKRFALPQDRGFLVSERHPDFPLYKVVMRDDDEEDWVILCGKDEHTGDLYTYRCPPTYLLASVERCRRWCLRANSREKIIEK